MITISSNHARKLFAVVLTVAAFAAIPGVASAQTIGPTSDQYDNTLQQVSRGGSACEDAVPGSAAAAECTPPPSSCAERAAAGSGEDCTPEAGGLPFTGLDVAALAAVAGFLLLAGIGLRRARFGERSQA